ESIQDFIVNPTDDPQTVTYTITPVFPGGGCSNGPQQTVVVTVNPTPNILLKISNDIITSDTAFCNGFEILFEVNNYQLTTGTVKYDLVVGGDIGIINGETPTTNNRDITNFSNILSHTDSQIRELNYRFIPYIENAYGTTGCYGGVDTTVNVKIVPVLKSEIPADTVYGGYHITCNGFNDGEILALPVGGDYRYSYSYSWEDSLGNELRTKDDVAKDSLEDLTAGTYYYTITDILGCYHDSTMTLIEPDPIAIVDDPREPACFNGTNDGAIYIDTVTGGAEEYAYDFVWKNENTEVYYYVRNLDSIYTGEYTLTLKDTNECTFIKEYKLESPEPVDANIVFRKGYGSYGVSCTDSTDGMIVVKGNGGEGPYQYAWYNSEFEIIEGYTDTLSGIGAGTYYSVVKDSRNCTGADSLLSVTVREPEPIRFNWKDETYTGGWHIQCNGDENGLITPQYTGGHFNTGLTAPPREHVYTWTGPGVVDDDSIQKNLGPGTYTLHVRDIGGLGYPDGYCSADTTFVLYEHPAITYDPPEIDTYIGGLNVSCHDSLDGAVQLLNIEGGGTTAAMGEYTYAWDVVETPANFELDVDSLSSIHNIPAGRYAFTITDQIGCSVSDTVELTQPDYLYAVPDTSFKNGYEISCFNGSDGWVSLLPSGGTRPYSYDWSEYGSATDTVITGLDEGYYSVTMTDQNGCENFYEWELEHPDTIVLNPDPARLIECFGDTSTIRISPEGGVAGYTYLWEGSVTSRDLTGVTEGTYHVEVTDANGCVISDSIYLGQRSRIMPEIVVRSDFNGRHISCYGAENAAIELVISGGNDSTYTFEWNTSTGDNNTPSLSGLPAGTYTVNGEDASGCPFDTVKQVIQPSDIKIMYTVVDPLCEGNENGSISISVVGGTPMTGSPIYNYSLNGEENLPAPEFENLAEGEYVIVVIDANNCADTTEVDLVAPDALSMEYETTPAECRDKPDGTLTINFINGGTMPYYINGGTSQYFDNLLPGDFVIELIDGNDCRLI
ncbi:MAG: SprB repeat-containing protein, partial [Bacteroidales bacterium]|nr:SprB repeat-containing protein [Bacteroidales bacterium]